MTHGLFGVESDSKPDKLPTLGQYVKRTKCTKQLTTQVVELIWLPGSFNNFTLQTPTYRIIISPKHGLYDAVNGFVNGGNETAEQGISVRITDWAKAKFVIEPDKRRGAWSNIGDSGQRWING